MQPTLFDPINDTTAAAAEEEESVGPIRNDITVVGGGREREKYNDGDDKSQVGLMIERERERGKEEKRKWENETS